MKALLTILTLITVLLVLTVALLFSHNRELEKRLSIRFTPDEVMSTWAHINVCQEHPLHAAFFRPFTEGDRKVIVDWIVASRLNSKKRLDEFCDTCRRINRID